MATLSQIEANRLNAQKSTGPRTPEGKAAVRFNAIKHGIDARFLVIPGERESDLDELAVRYHEQFHPETPVARYLVDTLVQCDWMRRRLMRLQATFFRALSPESCEDPDFPILGAERMKFQPEFLSRLFRQFGTMERHYFRALAELRRPPAEPPTGEIGFVPPENPAPEEVGQVAGVPSVPGPVANRPRPPAAPHPEIGFVPPEEALNPVGQTSRSARVLQDPPSVPPPPEPPAAPRPELGFVPSAAAREIQPLQPGPRCS